MLLIQSAKGKVESRIETRDGFCAQSASPYLAVSGRGNALLLMCEDRSTYSVVGPDIN